MPHDCNGTELKVGDVVTMRCKVLSVQPSDGAYSVEIVALDGPADEYTTITCNTKSLLREDSIPSV